MNPFQYLGITPALGMTLAMTLLWGCGSPPGKPRKGSEVPVPNEVVKFDTLYAENCSACHGREGRGGAAIALADPLYLSIVDDATIRKVIGNGVRGASMPAFVHSSGGMLTDMQVDVISSGIRSRWNQDILNGADPPSYFA